MSSTTGWQKILLSWIFLVSSSFLVAVVLLAPSLISTTSQGTCTLSLPLPPQAELSYECVTLPFQTTSPRDADETSLYVQFYDEPSHKLLQVVQTNLTTYQQVYRKISFDSWGKPYEEFKEALREWKVRHFAPVFPNPHGKYIIYESACGIGLNLALTVEILYEASSFQTIELHGSDYVDASVAVAIILYEQGHIVEPFKHKSHLGKFCTADSTRLSHVPSNTFELVFTGYITPLMDPFGMVPQLETKHDMDEAYEHLCNNQKNSHLFG